MNLHPVAHARTAHTFLYFCCPRRFPWCFPLNVSRTMAQGRLGRRRGRAVPSFLPTVVFPKEPPSQGIEGLLSRPVPGKVTKIPKCFRPSNHLSPQGPGGSWEPPPSYRWEDAWALRLWGLRVAQGPETLILKGGPHPPPP